jgi:hypothetical protein
MVLARPSSRRQRVAVSRVPLSRTGVAMSEQEKSVPGTWGAVVRSERPMPWRKMAEMCSFTPEEAERRLADGTFIREQMRRVKAAMELLK